MKQTSRDTSSPLPSENAQSVLLLLPTGREASVVVACLQEAGIQGQICHVLEEFCDGFETAAAGIVATEALSQHTLALLLYTLRQQPPWSDFPLLLLAHQVGNAESIWQIVQRLTAVGNITLLERPFHPVALQSSIAVALRSRRRQYTIRQLYEDLHQHAREQTTLLGKLRNSERKLQQLNEGLEYWVSERTAALEQQTLQLRHEMAERHRMQEALSQQEKLAALGTLLANIAHELNNPLAVATMQLNNLYESADASLRMEDLDTLRQALERCNSVVQGFLALAHQQPPIRNAVALHAIIDDVLVLLRHGLELDSVTLNFHLDEDVPLVWADAHQLHHVISNLVTNAHHALRQSDAPRHLTFTTMANAERTQVILEVSDTGSGIPKELQRRIFEPFFTTKAPDVGSGLGLLLCRNIIEGHGGTLHLQSQPGDGTRVSVALPAANADVQAPQEHTAPAETPPGQHGTILLIDDEPGMQQALQRLLQRNGHVITTASNGREGLAALERQTFDVILCDMRMPILDGRGFYRELQRRYPHLVSRLIFLTGDVLSLEIHNFFSQAGRPRLAKPFQVQEVRQVVQQLLAVR